MSADCVEFTHKGWFGLCPVILGDIEGNCYIGVKWDFLEYWLDLQVAIFDIAAITRQFFDHDYNPEGWMIKVTGPLKRKIYKK